MGGPKCLPGCDDPVDIDNRKVGRSRVICQTYMIPKGARALEVHWGDEGATNPPIGRLGNDG
ncbi:hypothetical protein GCM10010211_36790 [Streptomyces albospinus]|uniref:Uncharacterized protein n=1 Tax=Streptomyces albospinus TaxID=285515 RepID=A0ABQ2V708_9ACTN|nr:hypothetical protein [Streptomyces albospinus]GGU67953.1 hypothetical protein GCM10010211_36790 [Streptomyces albospinus]